MFMQQWAFVAKPREHHQLVGLIIKQSIIKFWFSFKLKWYISDKHVLKRMEKERSIGFVWNGWFNVNNMNTHRHLGATKFKSSFVQLVVFYLTNFSFEYSLLLGYFLITFASLIQFFTFCLLMTSLTFSCFFFYPLLWHVFNSFWQWFLWIIYQHRPCRASECEDILRWAT